VDCTCGHVHHLRARRRHRSSLGGLTSGTANWLNHRSEVRVQWILHEKTRRQTLYRDFIEEAAKCYIDALKHDEANIPGLVSLYAKLSSMRVPTLTRLPFSSKSLSAWPIGLGLMFVTVFLSAMTAGSARWGKLDSELGLPAAHFIAVSGAVG
jgi:hypothetical protein